MPKARTRRKTPPLEISAEATRWLEMALATVNAPRPTPISAAALLLCLQSSTRDPRWASHIEAFLTEVSADVLHHLVLDGAFGFTDLKRAKDTWIAEGKNDAWIEEMAGFEVGRNAGGRPSHP